MIPATQYRSLSKWIISICILLLPAFSFAQSDGQADTVTEDAVKDTTYTESEYASDTATFRVTPDTTISRLQGMKEFAYANDPDYWKKEKKPIRKRSSGAPILSAVISYLLIGIFVAVLIFLLYKILSDSKIFFFSRKKKTFSGQDIEEELLTKADLWTLIKEAEQNQQFRLAARYHYLRVLEELDSRQLIRRHGELTNWDYIRQLGAHPLNEKFRYLTSAYEYVWYGEFALTGDQYEFLKKRFETFLH